MKRLMLLLISALLVLALVSAASADELGFRNIDAFVDGKRFSNLEKDTTDFEVRSGEQLRLIIEVENLFSERDDIEIDDIELTVTIHDIRSNKDDLYHEFRDFGLDAGEEKDREVVFDIPDDAMTGEYILEIEARGRDDNKKDQEASFVFPLNLRKRAHDIIVHQLSLDPATVGCGDTATLSLGLENRGLVVENVKATVTNPELGVEHKYSTFIKVGSIDQNNRVTKDFLIRVPDDTEEGRYQLDVSIEYFRRTISRTAELTVECEPLAEPAPEAGEKAGISVVGKSVAESPANNSSIISFLFRNWTKEIAIFSGLGIIVLVLIFVIIGMLIRKG